MSLAALAIESRMAFKDVFLDGRKMGCARTRGETAALLDKAGHHEAADAARAPAACCCWDCIEGPQDFSVVRRARR